jgi:hypothetical protein
MGDNPKTDGKKPDQVNVPADAEYYQIQVLIIFITNS